MFKEQVKYLLPKEHERMELIWYIGKTKYAQLEHMISVEGYEEATYEYVYEVPVGWNMTPDRLHYLMGKGAIAELHKIRFEIVIKFKEGFVDLTRIQSLANAREALKLISKMGLTLKEKKI